jgi:hypothetical protein
MCQGRITIAVDQRCADPLGRAAADVQHMPELDLVPDLESIGESYWRSAAAA